MPLVVPFEEKRDCKICLNLTAADSAELLAEAKRRFPLTPAQLAYERYVRGAAAEKRGRSREVFRVVSAKEVSR